jgi:hypothetical protein
MAASTTPSPDTLADKKEIMEVENDVTKRWFASDELLLALFTLRSRHGFYIEPGSYGDYIDEEARKYGKKFVAYYQPLYNNMSCRQPPSGPEVTLYFGPTKRETTKGSRVIKPSRPKRDAIFMKIAKTMVRVLEECGCIVEWNGDVRMGITVKNALFCREPVPKDFANTYSDIDAGFEHQQYKRNWGFIMML